MKTAELTKKNVASFVAEIEKKKIDLHGFVIMQHGKTIGEGWWKPYGPDIRHQLYSLSKSFTSTAAGFAVTEGLISLDDPVVSFFPSKVPKNANDFMKRMKIRHLLSMSTGHSSEPMQNIRREKDWVKEFLIAPPTHEPGTLFLYNSMATYMVSAIIQKVTGMTVKDYLTPRLFEPLGINDPEWDSCPKGINAGGWGLWLSTPEISRFGQFLLQKGVWEGKQLIPSDWLAIATKAHIDNGVMVDGTPQPNKDWSQGYGFQFWRCQHGFYRGDGAFGQFCIVMEKYDMVIALNSGVNDLQGILDVVWKHLIPKGNASKEGINNQVETDLHSFDSLHYSPPALTGLTKQANEKLADWNNDVWIISNNFMSIEEISFSSTTKKSNFSIKDARGTHQVAFGWGEWVETKSSMKAHEYDKRRKFITDASAIWTLDGALNITIRFPETPETITIVFKKTDSQLSVNFSVNVTFDPTVLPELVGTLKL